MNNKRKIEKLFVSIDELTLPKVDKMLPPEALIKKDAPITEKRKPFSRFAVASLAMAALIVVTALIISSIASSAPENTKKDAPAALDSQLIGYESIFSSVSSEESKVQKKDMPIVSCGNYNSNMSNACERFVPYGEVAIETMRGASLSESEVDKLQDDVLYAVYFSADYDGYGDYFAPTEYNKEIRRLDEEGAAKRKEAEERAIAFIEKHAKAENHPFLDSYHFRNFNYHEICEAIYQNPTEYWPGQDDPEFEEVSTAVRRIWDEYEEKRWEFVRITRENTTAKMYKYLDSLGIEFYDKTVYIVDPLTGNEDILSEEVYRVAFLTKEEILSLKGGEDYGLRVVLVFEELAKPDNEPVYLQPWFVNA